jgi:hypothetical protein
VSRHTRSQLLGELENLRANRLALTERLCRILTAMAMSEEVSADLYQRLGAVDDHPNGHRAAAVTSAEAAHTYRQLLSRLTDRMDSS